MAGKKVKAQGKNQSTHNPQESLRDLAGFFADGFKTSLKHDILEKGQEDFWKQIADSFEEKSERKPTKLEGDLKPGEELDLSKLKENASQTESLAGLDYRSEILNKGEQLRASEKKELQQAIEQIRFEIKQLIDKTTLLQEEYAEVTVQEPPKSPGKYHLTFFTWLLAVIRSARMKVEDGGVWLSTMNKKKKLGFWGMAKKYGTSFSQSNERALATQTG